MSAAKLHALLADHETYEYKGIVAVTLGKLFVVFQTVGNILLIVLGLLYVGRYYKFINLYKIVEQLKIPKIYGLFIININKA